MRKNSNSRTEISPTKSINKLLVLFASSLVCINAHALTLGNIKVLSNIGEPLRAEIQIPSITAEELKTAQAAFASNEVFQRAGFRKNVSLLNADFDFVVHKNNRVTLRITGSKPVNEPFLDLVVVAATQKESFSRDYTILLEPSNLLTAQAPKKAPLKIAPQRPAAARPIKITSRQPTTTAQRPAPVRAAALDTQGVISVNKGDVAYRIALNILNSYDDASGINVNQVVRALVQHNPKAFVNNNAHIMLAGAKLRVPSVNQVKRFSKAAIPPPAKSAAIQSGQEGVSQASGQIITEVKQPAVQDKDVLTVTAPSEITEQKLSQIEQQDKLKSGTEISSKVDDTIAAAEAALEAALAEHAGTESSTGITEASESKLAATKAEADASKTDTNASKDSAATPTPAEAATSVAEKPSAVADTDGGEISDNGGIISKLINNMLYIGGFLAAFALLLLLLVLRRKKADEENTTFDDSDLDDADYVDADLADNSAADDEIPAGLDIDIAGFLDTNAPKIAATAAAAAVATAAVTPDEEKSDLTTDNGADDFFIQFTSDAPIEATTAAMTATENPIAAVVAASVAAAAVESSPTTDPATAVADEPIKLQPQAPLVNVGDLLHEQESAGKVIDVDKLDDAEFADSDDSDSKETSLQLQLDLAKQLAEFGAKDDAISILKTMLSNSATSAEMKAQATALLQQLG